MQTFLDEVDAMSAGMDWLRTVGQREGAERLGTTEGVGDGGICGAWKGNTLLAYFIVVRDLLNWSVLVTHDLSLALKNRLPEPGRIQIPLAPEGQFLLPFETELHVRGEEVSIESQLGRELSRQATSLVESARVVGVVEGIEQLLMSLARVGADLNQPIFSKALADCVARVTQ